MTATIAARGPHSAGLLNQDRLFNNLLSSQPLAFNFFGELEQDLSLAKKVFASLIPGLEEVTAVLFEYAPTPKEKYTGDNSAFDVALEIRVGGRTGLLGLECKYTDSFSAKEYDSDKYRSVFNDSAAFADPYPSYTASQFNQLFRNQLIAEALQQNGKYAFCLTGLFCFDGDEAALQTGKAFQSKLHEGQQQFKIIRYSDFIAIAQQQSLPASPARVIAFLERQRATKNRINEYPPPSTPAFPPTGENDYRRGLVPKCRVSSGAVWIPACAHCCPEYSD